MKEFFVADAATAENEIVTSHFLLSSLQLRDGKQGGQYLALVLSDKTGQIDGRMWEAFAEILPLCKPGCYVKVQGKITKYQGKFQITPTRMKAVEESEIDTADYFPTTAYDMEELWAELRGYVDGFTSEPLRALVVAFLEDPILGPQFKRAPAAKRLHHAWLGGLLEHVVTLVRVCRATAPFYPEVDPDLLVAGAILHDIGKLRELEWASTFGYTLEGQLIGHISIAQRLLAEKAAEVPNFPDRLRFLLEHMILSHHGKYEFGSPKLPMTPEAILLSMLDDLEAKMQTVRSEFASATASGKKPDEMTEWVRSMDRPLLNSRAYLAADPAASGAVIEVTETVVTPDNPLPLPLFSLEEKE